MSMSPAGAERAIRARRIPAWALLAGLALMLAACVRPEISTRNCDIDWRAVGYAEGASGVGPEMYLTHQATCARIGDRLTSADRVAWMRGWREGSADPRNHRRDNDAGNNGVPRKRFNVDLFYGSGGSGDGRVGVFVDVFQLGLNWRF